MICRYQEEHSMKKFAVFSGFLGAGKTTLMMALVKYCTEHCCMAAMISNDLGRGVMLADHKLALLSGCKAEQITDECICFCHDVLTERLNALYVQGCGLVISDIPGFGVGALEHVYHGLTESYSGQFELAPFTVVIEPHSVDRLCRGEAGDEGYILEAQLKEADLIVLNKCDLLEAQESIEQSLWLKIHFPQAEVLTVSAVTGKSIDALCMALLKGSASLRHPDIDYDDEDLQNAMDSLSELFLQFRALVCCNDFDGNAYLTEIAAEIRQDLRMSGFDVPHFKLLAWSPDGDFGKADILGTDRPVELAHRFIRPCTDIAVIFNATAVCPDSALNRSVWETVKRISEKYQLEITVFKKDSIALGD